MIPHFTLQAQDGSTVRVSDFRGRKNLVVIFPAGNNLSLVPALQDRESELIEENVAVLVIRADSEFPQRTHHDKPTQVRALCDPQNEVARRFGVEGEPVVYIT